MTTTLFRNTIVAGLTAACFAVTAWAQQGAIRGHVEGLKQSLTQSKQQLKQYQWMETTVVLLKGEEKSRKQYLCHYDAGGTVQKVLVEASPEKHEPGIRGHIIERKKEELTDYMRRAVDLVKLYVPPNADKIQAAKDAGNASLTPIEPGRRVRLSFRNYQMPGDLLAIDVAPTSNQVLGATVSTYLDDPNDAVELVIQFAALPDGTSYPSSVNLNAQAKSVTVEITNSDYRKVTN
jgi:hypothetical protein